MTHLQLAIALASILAAAGIWLMLPRGGARGRTLGVILASAALGILTSQVPWIGSWASGAAFYVLAGLTVISATATVTFRNPVYCAIWFGLTLLGVAGLFLFQGAQFLGVATVVVYAGAILVTFLFVLMLAQPAGDAYYDRLSWEALLSASAGAVMIGALVLSIIGALRDEGGAGALPPPPTSTELAQTVLADKHVARLGGELFGRRLIEVEIAGTLLLVALVGTVSIVSQVRSIKKT